VTRCGLHTSVTSGFAFPSAEFSSSSDDVPLLRGANISVGKLRWEDVVYWKRSDGDGLRRFELAEGDIVLGMDRPVISGGVRVARVTARDLPCLLLQRVVKRTGNFGDRVS
jgi:type I restriction enzyme S subunit